MRFYAENARKYFEETSGSDPAPLCASFLDHLMKKFRAGRPEGSPKPRVVDLGCGSGRDMRYLSSKGAEVFGADASFELLSISSGFSAGRDGRLASRLVCARLEALPFKTSAFDGAIAQASLLHLPKNAIGGVLGRIEDILLPGGVFYFSLKEGDGEALDEKGRFFAYYREEEMRRILAGGRFAIKLVTRERSLDGRDVVWLGFLLEKK